MFFSSRTATGFAARSSWRSAPRQRQCHLLVEAARRTADVDPRRALELLALAGEAAALADDDAAGIAIGELAASLDIDVNARDRFFVALLVGFGHQAAGETAAALAAIREAIEAAAEELDDPDLLLAAGRAGFLCRGRRSGAPVQPEDRRARTLDRIGRLPRDRRQPACLRRDPDGPVGEWACDRAGNRSAGRRHRAVRAGSARARLAVGRGGMAWRQRIRRRSRRASPRILGGTSDGDSSTMQRAGPLGIVELNAGRAAAADTQLRRITHPVVSICVLPGSVRGRLARGKHRSCGARGRRARLVCASVRGTLGACTHRSLPRLAGGRRRHRLRTSSRRPSTNTREQRGRSRRAAPNSTTAPFSVAGRRRADARTPLRDAFEIFDSLGATPWAERAQAELRATGETVRRREPAELGRLTPQELQVARFVAQGLSNREVAAQLFLSPRTIDFHLRNVFSKLGLTSRVELATLSLGTPPTQPVAAATALA